MSERQADTEEIILDVGLQQWRIYMDYKITKLAVFVLLFIAGCKTDSNTIIHLKNSSEEKIAVANSYVNMIENAGPDFFIETKESRYSIYLCSPHSLHTVHGWADSDKDIAMVTDTFVCYIMPATIAQTCSWDSIMEHKLAHYKYMLSLDDLSQLGYEIPYPPTIETKNMKIINLQENEN